MLALAPSAGAASPNGVAHRHVRVCSAVPAGFAACDAIRDDVVTTSGKATPLATAPVGKSPADIRSAYALTGAASGGKTVAIVDAYNAPNAESDLNVYRTQFGIPACTKASGCFRQVSQTGSTRLPRNDGGWAQEISLDLDMVSATCPDCKILLVEASTASFADLSAAVKYAASQHVAAISNSYGGSDSSGTTSTAAAYKQPGIAVTASTGDNGYGVESPASFPTVVAVGGTSLTQDSSGAWSETAWSGAGSGCSSLNAKPSYQTDATQCLGKATADVSAVADPATGVAVYDSYSYGGASGWLKFGGTSVSSPIIASIYAMGQSTGNTALFPADYTWHHATALKDVTSGTNGTTCTTAVWCSAGTASGWDGPTGLGTPIGTGAF
jgi:subtilase family serine protease